jgi:hypothetical protein
MGVSSVYSRVEEHMKTYLKERIGHPALFTGRKKELNSLLKWVANIKPEISKS